jgi:hypothetical protein
MEGAKRVSKQGQEQGAKSREKAGILGGPQMSHEAETEGDCPMTGAERHWKGQIKAGGGIWVILGAMGVGKEAMTSPKHGFKKSSLKSREEGEGSQWPGLQYEL